MSKKRIFHTDLVKEIKTSGQFDTLRSSLLSQFTASTEGKDFTAYCTNLAENTTVNPANLDEKHSLIFNHIKTGGEYARLERTYIKDALKSIEEEIKRALEQVYDRLEGV